jgi:cell division protein FtsI/penicillin-binding protein 2
MDVKTGDILAEANLDAAPASSSAPVGSTTTTTTTTPPAAAALAARTVAAATSASGSSAASFTSPVDTLPAGVVEAPSNTAVTQVYEPGSVFKLVTFSASLQDGIINPQTPFVVPGALPVGGYMFHDAEAHGTETLTASNILAQSSNIGTIEIASKLGETRLLGQIANLGFGKPTGLNFPGESQGLVLGPAAWTGSSIGSTPIGQDDAVTAQQLIDAYNAVANGGVFVQPRLVRGTVNADGSVTPAPPSPTRRVIAPAIDSKLTTMFEGVVTHGTGTSGAIAGYAVAGKTGTAQIPSPNHVGYTPGAFYGTFAGLAPAQAPVLSAVVGGKDPPPPDPGSAGVREFLYTSDSTPPTTRGFRMSSLPIGLCSRIGLLRI